MSGSSKTARRPHAAWTILLIAWVTCTGTDDAVHVLRTDSAGVEIVTSPSADAPAPFKLEREWTVGGVDGGLELTEIMPWHVAADATGYVYILDDAGKRVFVLDSGGEVRDTLGRAGKGPGELSTPVSLHVAADGTVGVWDYGQGGLVRWRDGEPLPIQRVSVSFWGADVRMVNGLVAFVTMSGNGVVQQRLVIGDSLQSRAVAELAARQGRPAEFPTCGIRGIPIPPLFALELNWDVTGNRILASTSASYEVRVVDVDALPAGSDGAALVHAIWRRAIPTRPATESLALREVGDGLRIPVTGCTVPPAEVVRGRGFEDVVPAIRRLVADRQGRVWVLRGGLSDEPNVVDVFEPSGAYLGTLSDGAPVPVAFPGDERLVGLETGESGERVLASWRLR